MPVAIITGAGGLIGSEASSYFARQGFDVIGIDNDMRAAFFGPEASTAPTMKQLGAELGGAFRPVNLDIRDGDGLMTVFRRHSRDIELIIHAASQPSHEWAAREPDVDFAVNATATLNLLQAARTHAPAAVFVFMSTNKVYGDRPNALPLEDCGARLDLPRDHPWYGGVDVSMSIDMSTHSLFGVSKTAADLLVQEYGRYFDMPTVCFRGGCLTGPRHTGAELHGFLAYLMKCAVTGRPYTIFGYEGKQVRDNIHSHDVVRAFHEFARSPRKAAVYNLGGGRSSSLSVLEAIALCEEIADRPVRWTLSHEPRIGDHRWWITSLDAFSHDYPAWSPSFAVEDTLREIHQGNIEQWAGLAV